MYTFLQPEQLFFVWCDFFLSSLFVVLRHQDSDDSSSFQFTFVLSCCPARRLRQKITRITAMIVMAHTATMGMKKEVLFSFR